MNVTRRPETPRDETFLRKLISDTIAGELGAGSWPEPMRGHLLGIQVSARRQSHRGNVIEVDGQRAGWIVVTTMPDEVRLVEIMVAPEFRGKGIGTAAIREVLANAAGRPVRLSVNVTNRAAIRLYERLGFRWMEGDEVQHVLEWTASLRSRLSK
jgi:ribosomal protein S18 acetylase RimI-like enzyme